MGKTSINLMMMGLLLTVVLGITGCGGGGSDSASTTKTVPIAIATTINSLPYGTGNVTITGDRVYLAGSNSYIPVTDGPLFHVSTNDDPFNDLNGDPLLTYNWTCISKPLGSNVVLSSATAEKPIFTADHAGSYALNLVVNNGESSSTATTVTIILNDPPLSAPSRPTGLKITQASSNSVSLSWDASTGGYGGVSGYDIYRNGTYVSGSSAAATIFTDTHLKPSRPYTYTVASRSLVGTYSAQSIPVATTTLSLSLMLSKFVPVILFDTLTGKIQSQGYASPEMMSKATVSTGNDVIIHAKVDGTQYKITSTGNRIYGITSFATNLPIETNIVAPRLATTATSNSSYATMDMVTGATRSIGSGGGLNFYQIRDDYGTYIPGEIL